MASSRYGWEVCLLICAASGGYASHRNWVETQRGIWVLCHVQQVYSILAAESGQAGAHLPSRQRIARYSNHLVSSGFRRNRGHEYGIRIEDLIEAHSVRD
jgi:hypothetical protein